MRVPSDDLIARTISDRPISWPIEHLSGAGWAEAGGGKAFSIVARGPLGATIGMALPDGGDVRIHLRVNRGLGAFRRRSWFDLEFDAPGFLDPPGAPGLILAKGLTDTDQLTRKPAGARFVGLVEAALVAYLAAAVQLQAQADPTPANRAAAAAATLAAEQAAASLDLARFRGTERRIGVVDPYSIGPSIRETEQRDEQGGARGVVVNERGWRVVDVTQTGRYDYAVSPDLVTLMIRGVNGQDHRASLTVLAEVSDADPRPRKLDRAIIVYRGWQVEFAHCDQIKEPGLAGLASEMCHARNEVFRVLGGRAAARDVWEQARTGQLGPVIARQAEPAPPYDRPVLDTQLLSLPSGLPDRRLRELIFRQLADDSWASDALVAVRYGQQGRKIYAEAIHLPGARGGPRFEHRPDHRMPRIYQVDERDLRARFGLDPIILGWIASPEVPDGLTPTADPVLWDENYVSDPAWATVAPVRQAKY